MADEFEQHRLMKSGLDNVYADGGLLDQANQAKAIGDGAFMRFLKQIISEYGPQIGALLVSLLGGILHLPTLPPVERPAPPASKAA